MEYNLTLQNETFPISLDLGEENNIQMSVGDKKYDISYSWISDNQIYMAINGKCINAFVVNDPGGKTICIKGSSYRVTDADTAEQSRTKKGAGGNLPDTITPPMPAVVVSVMVNEGDMIEKGQGAVVVSAMKMETTLVAPFAGKVMKVNVIEGDKVMPGQILIDIE